MPLGTCARRGTVLLGFEQANLYTVYDEAGQLVAHLIEEEGSLGRALGRQLLRTRRPFTATVLSPDGKRPRGPAASSPLPPHWEALGPPQWKARSPPTLALPPPALLLTLRMQASKWCSGFAALSTSSTPPW